MKNIIVPVLLVILFSACSKVSLKRLEGTWEVKGMKTLPSDTLDTWKNLLDTMRIKVVFYNDGGVKTFYFQDDVLAELSEGDYLLSEDEGELIISDESLIFNSKGRPLEVTNLRRHSMTLEGRYYLNYIFPALPADSYVTLQWDLDK